MIIQFFYLGPQDYQPNLQLNFQGEFSLGQVHFLSNYYNQHTTLNYWFWIFHVFGMNECKRYWLKMQKLYIKTINKHRYIILIGYTLTSYKLIRIHEIYNLISSSVIIATNVLCCQWIQIIYSSQVSVQLEGLDLHQAPNLPHDDLIALV